MVTISASSLGIAILKSPNQSPLTSQSGMFGLSHWLRPKETGCSPFSIYQRLDNNNSSKWHALFISSDPWDLGKKLNHPLVITSAASWLNLHLPSFLPSQMYLLLHLFLLMSSSCFSSVKCWKHLNGGRIQIGLCSSTGPSLEPYPTTCELWNYE